MLEKSKSNNEETSVNFVLAVLREHEIEFDRLIAEFEILVQKVDELSNKIQRKVT